MGLRKFLFCINIFIVRRPQSRFTFFVRMLEIRKDIRNVVSWFGKALRLPFGIFTPRRSSYDPADVITPVIVSFTGPVTD